ncbi:MAG TPA: hypothetical protein VG318_16940 [Actinomycetota bacterium]|nr:hypothetical protein [Actinomycetota bacterium]
MARTVVGLVLALVLGVAGAACGTDDGASVRSSGSASGSGSGSGSGTRSGSGSATGVATGEAGCTEVGAGRLEDTEVHVELDEWSVVPDAGSVAAGAVKFEIANVGEDEHELAVTRAKSIDSLPLAADDSVDIPALDAAGSFVGEVEAFPAGTECSGVFDLEPGRYVLFCNLVHEEEDGVENHFQEGMATELTVSAAG